MDHHNRFRSAGARRAPCGERGGRRHRAVAGHIAVACRGSAGSFFRTRARWISTADL